MPAMHTHTCQRVKIERRPRSITARGSAIAAEVTESGQDFVVFQDHARMPVAQIADCEPTSHAPPSDMRKIHETP